jgi:hypothetical protein
MGADIVHPRALQGPVAQSAEHLTFNQGVVGSNPTGLTIFFRELYERLLPTKFMGHE